MRLDVLHEHLSHAAVVLDAGIAADRLTTEELKMLMHIAVNFIESAQNEATEPTCSRKEVGA
jgi:hypothetical protein